MRAASGGPGASGGQRRRGPGPWLPRPQEMPRAQPPKAQTAPALPRTLPSYSVGSRPPSKKGFCSSEPSERLPGRKHGAVKMAGPSLWPWGQSRACPCAAVSTVFSSRLSSPPSI